MSLNRKDGEISDISALKACLQIMQYESEMDSANQHDQPFSAGILDVDHRQTVNELGSELADGKSEHAATRAYYRQVDDAYNMEAEELAKMMKKKQESVENKMGGKFEERTKYSPSPKMARPESHDHGRYTCTQWAF